MQPLGPRAPQQTLSIVQVNHDQSLIHLRAHLKNANQGKTTHTWIDTGGRNGDIRQCYPDLVAQREPQVTSQQASHDNTVRSEEHTSELQLRGHLVCRLLLET